MAVILATKRVNNRTLMVIMNRNELQIVGICGDPTVRQLGGRVLHLMGAEIVLSILTVASRFSLSQLLEL